MPTDALPLVGRDGDVPEPVEELVDVERRYYDWAWSTPAAAAWHDSDAEIVAEWARLKALVARYLVGDVFKAGKDGVLVPSELPTGLLSQVTNREDRLFLSPMARKKGRTKIVEGDPTSEVSLSDCNVVRPDRWQRRA